MCYSCLLKTDVGNRRSSWCCTNTAVHIEELLPVDSSYCLLELWVLIIDWLLPLAAWITCSSAGSSMLIIWWWLIRRAPWALRRTTWPTPRRLSMCRPCSGNSSYTVGWSPNSSQDYVLRLQSLRTLFRQGNWSEVCGLFAVVYQGVTVICIIQTCEESGNCNQWEFLGWNKQFISLTSPFSPINLSLSLSIYIWVILFLCLFYLSVLLSFSPGTLQVVSQSQYYHWAHPPIQHEIHAVQSQRLLLTRPLQTGEGNRQTHMLSRILYVKFSHIRFHKIVPAAFKKEDISLTEDYKAY